MAVSIHILTGNPNLGSLLAWNLKECSFTVHQSASISSAMTLWSQQQPKLVVLDTDVCPAKAIEFCRWIFAKRRSLIFVLSSQSSEQEIVRLLQAGADDYLVKPFGLPQFLARVQALLRRLELNPKPTTFLDYGSLQIDLMQRKVKFHGEPIELTPQEFNLLFILAQAEGEPVSRTDLLELGWPDQITNQRTVDTHILSLRKKLEIDPQQPHLIQTVRQVGYRFNVDAPNFSHLTQTMTDTDLSGNSISLVQHLF
ncbi:MAG: response regulator transcription factor [Pseudanabaenaceae cyanobacterium bins.68]|nr:response regulator transcription factor [Pseudanabaenaceae cyanobacterium bins.68]